MVSPPRTGFLQAGGPLSSRSPTRRSPKCDPKKLLEPAGTSRRQAKTSPGVLRLPPLSGRPHTPSWLAVGAATCIVIFALAPAGAAERSHELSRLRAESVDIAHQKRAAVLQLYALDSQLGSAQARLSSLEADVARLETERASVLRELTLATLDSRLTEQRIALRLRYLYDYGLGTSSLDVLLGSTSVEQALTRLDDVNQVDVANQNIVVQLDATRRHLGDLSRLLAERERSLQATRQAVSTTVLDLAAAGHQRSAYISTLENREAYASDAIAQLDAEAQAAAARSARLAQAAELAAARQARQRADAPHIVDAPAHIIGVAAAPAPTSATPPPASAQASNSGPQELDPSASPSPVATGATTTAAAPSAPGSETITVVATGYSLSGRTSTGLPVGYGIAAVDPGVIPLVLGLIVLAGCLGVVIVAAAAIALPIRRPTCTGPRRPT